MMTSFLSAWLIALGAGLIVFAGTYWLARKADNYGVVDVVWAYQFIAYAILYGLLLDGGTLRTVLFAGLVGIWSLRLGIHLQRRVRAEHPREDPRYAELRESWRERFDSRMFLFFVAQGIVGWLVALPFSIPAGNPAPGVGFWEISGVMLGVLGVAVQAWADRDLRRFKENPGNQGQVCRAGLWAWSRHPNYFGEWLVWMALAVFACGSPYGWLAFLSPLLMLYLLLEVTGVPPSERRALHSKGELYRAYQRTTNTFFPGLVRGESTPGNKESHG